MISQAGAVDANVVLFLKTVALKRSEVVKVEAFFLGNFLSIFFYLPPVTFGNLNRQHLAGVLGGVDKIRDTKIAIDLFF